jgi:parallel beta-helix repeat protein
MQLGSPIVTATRRWVPLESIKLSLRAAVLAGLACLAPVAADATTYYVDKNASNCSYSGPGSAAQPFCSINTAAGLVAPGDTVVVRAASYAQQVNITRSGTASDPITFAGEAGATVTGKSYGFNIAAQWVIVQGFIVAATIADGIRCILCTSVTIQNNQINDAGGKGLYIRDSANMTLANNVVQRSNTHGIYMENDTGFLISGGSVSQSGHRVSGQNKKGIYVTGCTDSTILGTEVFDNSDIGIFLINSTSRVRVKATITHDNARGFERVAAGIETQSDGNIIESNISHDNEDSAINMRYGGSNSLVFNNIGHNNGDHGIDVLESPGVTIINNSLFDNVTAGINVEGNSPGATIANNISVDNGLNPGTHVVNGQVVERTKGNVRVTNTSAQGTTADYNIVYSSTGDYVYQWNGIYYRTLTSLTHDNPTVEVHGILADPAWAAPASDDFHLTAVSPAIDSANSGVSDAPSVDSEGHARCDDLNTVNTGAGPIDYADRGALEFLAAGCSLDVGSL